MPGELLYNPPVPHTCTGPSPAQAKVGEIRVGAIAKCACGRYVERVAGGKRWVPMTWPAVFTAQFFGRLPVEKKEATDG